MAAEPLEKERCSLEKDTAPWKRMLSLGKGCCPLEKGLRNSLAKTGQLDWKKDSLVLQVLGLGVVWFLWCWKLFGGFIDVTSFLCVFSWFWVFVCWFVLFGSSVVCPSCMSCLQLLWAPEQHGLELQATSEHTHSHC